VLCWYRGDVARVWESPSAVVAFDWNVCAALTARAAVIFLSPIARQWQPAIFFDALFSFFGETPAERELF
jgi:hypothetical protein